jgi:hypothetical protein
MYGVMKLMETKTRKAEAAHKIIETGESLLNVVWSKADERRAASLEIIARTAYTAEESACHYLETIGLDQKGNIRETLELARYQDTNEQTHEDIFARDLNGLKNWGDRFLARHIAVIIYWVFAITTLIDHELAALLGEAVEVEAVATYKRMLVEQSDEWLNQPAVPTAVRYWNKPNSMWKVRGDNQPMSMRDVVEAIVKDEADHVHANSQKAVAF